MEEYRVSVQEYELLLVACLSDQLRGSLYPNKQYPEDLFAENR